MSKFDFQNREVFEIKPRNEEFELDLRIEVYKRWRNERSFINDGSIFLAGTIDCGNSEDWQSEVIYKIRSAFECTSPSHADARILRVFNPRRSPGDGFSPDNKEEMDYQVNWELDRLDEADLILMYLKADSKSPISLMELGLFAASQKLVVVCEPGFYRYHNVRIVCERNGVPMFDSLDDIGFQKLTSTLAPIDAGNKDLVWHD